MPESKLLGEIRVFGVSLLSRPGQQHAAIVFKEREKKSLSLLHLASHYDLRLEPWKPTYKCVPCQYFDDEELQYFAEHASKVYSENTEGIPYGFEYVGASAFNGDAKFIDTAGAGLTCATFILAFFEDLGYEVFDLDSWSKSPQDAEWQNDIFGLLCRAMTPEKAAAQYHLIGDAVRYKPEEVVGAIGVFKSDPITFSDASALGAKLLAEVAPC